MDKRVVVENTLRQHIDFLKKCGYEVDEISKPQDMNNIQSFDYDAVVVSSMKNTRLDATSYRPSAPIVEAEGKSPEEVFNILRTRY